MRILETVSREFSDVGIFLEFISRAVSHYSFAEQSDDLTERKEAALFFFRKSFLDKKKWVIFPLWGGNLSGLASGDGTLLNVVEKIKNIYRSRNFSSALCSAFVEKCNHLWYSDFSDLQIAGKLFSIQDDWEDLFGVRTVDGTPVAPYMGNIFLWPKDERFAIYLDGDNLGFIAGEYAEIESLVGKKFDECLREFILFNERNHTVPALYLGLADFCASQRLRIVE